MFPYTAPVYIHLKIAHHRKMLSLDRIKTAVQDQFLPAPLLLEEIAGNILLVVASDLDARAYLTAEPLLLPPGVGWQIFIQASPQPELFWSSSFKGANLLPGKIDLSHNLPEPIMAQIISVETSRSQYARQNWQYINALPGTTYVHSTDPDRGYECLEVATSITESQLHRGSRAASIGTPLTEFAPAIASHRKAAIEQAISSGQNQFYTYHYDDLNLGLTFVFPSEVILQPQLGEVVVRVHNEPFTEEYWKRRIKAGTAKPVLASQ